MQIDQGRYTERTLKRRPQMEIKVVPSYDCDINCSYCYNRYLCNYNAYHPNYPRLIETLSRILLKNEINAIVEIIGGEPLTSKTYPKTKGIIEHLTSLERDVKVVLQTASSDIEKLLEVIPKLDGLSYSIDLSSSPKVMNLANLETIVRCCKKYDVIIQVQTVLSPKDKAETIRQFVDLCALHGVGWIGLGYPTYQLYAKEEMDSQLVIYSELIRHLKKFRGISIGGAIVESAIDFLKGNRYSSFCMCGENSVTIQPDGSLSPSLCFEPNAFESLDTFVKAKYEREKKLREGYCSDCEIWNVCHGGCMGHAKFLTGDMYSHDNEFCYLISGVIKKLKSIEIKPR